MKKTLFVTLITIISLVLLPTTAFAAETFNSPKDGEITKSFAEFGGIEITSEDNTFSATADGTIIQYSKTTIAIDHGEGLRTIYYLVENSNLSSGDTVIKGDVIGISKSNKLYFEIRKYNEETDVFDVVDPGNFIPSLKQDITSIEVNLDVLVDNPNLDISKEDFDFFCRVIMGEVGGYEGDSEEETYYGMLAVAESMINRVQNPKFPNSLIGVLKKEGQYSCINEPWFATRVYTPEVVAVATAALEGESITIHEVSGGATSYYYPSQSDVNAGGWMQRNLVCTSIHGKHVFGNFKSELSKEVLSKTVKDSYGNIWINEETLNSFSSKLDSKFD